MRVDAIVDLQYGSTGKGKIAALLARSMKYDASVRVQSIQAGHTIYYNGKDYKMRTIPCAWVRPEVKLILGPGIFIEKELLMDEIAMINEATGEDVRKRLFVDFRATYIENQDFVTEEGLAKAIGSTQEGAGASLVRKIARAGGTVQVKDTLWAAENGINVVDTVDLLNRQDRVMLEGCQGTMLSVHTSPFYPYCTSRECTVAGIMSEAGMAPADIDTVHGVFRTYPIRVGGNSGSTFASEITWEEVGKRSHNPDLKPEITTVTKRQRRIFEFSMYGLKHAVQLNKPDYLHCGFINYLNHEDYGLQDWEDLTMESKAFVQYVERETGVPVLTVGTGEKPHHIIRR
jgi:adenylosuccinate synthase